MCIRDRGKIDYMALIGDNQVRMANICAYTANSINGVSKLHSEIIKQTSTVALIRASYSAHRAKASSMADPAFSSLISSIS